MKDDKSPQTIATINFKGGVGKKKPSRKALTDLVMSRINESIMLSKHLNREEIVSRS
jgi:hypothetical protein